MKPNEAVDKLEGLEASQESNEDREQDINISENKSMKSFAESLEEAFSMKSLEKSLEEGMEEAFAPFKNELGKLNRQLCLLQNIRKGGHDDKQENLEKNAETNKDEENTDNIEAAKIMAVNQKQSIKGYHTQV